jgi:glutathione S-transferase
MITLYGFGENLGVKDPSPMVLKVETYLRMAGIAFTCENNIENLKKAPKGKLPFINDAGKIVADSQFILEYLKKNHVDLDEHLSDEEKAQAYLLTKSLDENLYFCLAYSRWMVDDTWKVVKKAFFSDMPPIIKTIVPNMIRKKLKNTLYAQGLGRHSHEEILHITHQSFQALSDILGNKKYFFGEHPCSFDASAYGMLASAIETSINDEFTQMARKHENLVSYCKRIKIQFYS